MASHSPGGGCFSVSMIGTSAALTRCHVCLTGLRVTYALALWPKLTRFLEHPEVELSNNLAENSMRPVAPGRKNRIHVGSPQAGPKVAAILSILESCRRLKVPVRDYLGAVLPGLANTSIQRLAELT
ncbi:MAG TPA: transposase, partial [Bryobacteraceae bacterium]|nr:transposase [Bryobacteraceae bacterium]